MAGFVLFCKAVLSIVICFILIVSSSKTATTHSGKRWAQFKDEENHNVYI